MIQYSYGNQSGENGRERVSEITAITPQVKDKTRCNVFVDGRFYCGLTLEAAIKNRLKAGQTVDPARLSEIQLESERNSALDKALHFISAAQKTEKQIRDYLSGKGYLPAVTDYVLGKMAEYGFLDDGLYAQRYAESAVKRKGARLIRAELRAKGIAEEHIGARPGGPGRRGGDGRASARKIYARKDGGQADLVQGLPLSHRQGVRLRDGEGGAFGVRGDGRRLTAGRRPRAAERGGKRVNKVKIVRLEEVDSTNLYAKARAGEGEDLVVTAKRQTGGMGTKGRSFSSEEGGVYLTRLTFYRNFSAAEAFRVMAGASVAVCRTLERFGLSAGIKWPNDVYVQGRKICGILIENIFSGPLLSRSIVGIGLNVNNELPAELSGVALSMRGAAGRPFDREEVENVLIEESGKSFPVSEYLSRLQFLGEEAVLVCGEERIPARILSVDERGGLIAETAEGKRRFTAAEVSLRVPTAEGGRIL